MYGFFLKNREGVQKLSHGVQAPTQFQEKAGQLKKMWQNYDVMVEDRQELLQYCALRSKGCDALVNTVSRE